MAGWAASIHVRAEKGSQPARRGVSFTPLHRRGAVARLAQGSATPGADSAPTPRIRRVPAGSRTLSLGLKGYSPIDKAVVVRAGEQTRVVERLVKRMGTLVVKSSPVGARVRLDGRYVGRTST